MCKSKGFTLILILMLSVSSLMIIKPAFAQSIPTPSVPEFTVTFVPASYNTTDPYTGATQQVDNSTIELSITNQPYTYTNGSTFSIYYNVFIKDHFAYAWTQLYPIIKLLPQAGNYDTTNFQNYQTAYIWGEKQPLSSLPQSNSTYTTVEIPATNYLSDRQVDIKIQAILGVNSTYYLPAYKVFNFGGTYLPAVAYVTSSESSNIQTVTIPASVSASPTPVIPEFPSTILIITFLVTATLLGTVVIKKKQFRRRTAGI